MTQQSLFTSKAPRVTAADVAWMLAALDGKGWRTVKWLQRSIRLSDRTFRAIAAASQGQVISGQRGYARTDQSSVEDVNHAADWMASQGMWMIRRAQEIRKALHIRRTA